MVQASVFGMQCCKQNDDSWLRRHVLQALLAAVPEDTIDAWIVCKPPLDPRRLLPALMNACEASQDRELQSFALRFVEHCISHGCTDTTLHNLAVRLSGLHSLQYQSTSAQSCKCLVPARHASGKGD